MWLAVTTGTVLFSAMLHAVVQVVCLVHHNQHQLEACLVLQQLLLPLVLSSLRAPLAEQHIQLLLLGSHLVVPLLARRIL